jgi:hypothetical protein
MEQRNRSTRDNARNRRNNDLGVYGPDRTYNDMDDRNLDEGMRTYAGSSGSNWGGTYDSNRAWPNNDLYGYDDSMFTRMDGHVSDRIRDTWDDWSGTGSSYDGRMDRDMRRLHNDHRSYGRGSREYMNDNQRRGERFYDHERNYDNTRDQRHNERDKNFFQRAGERMREFFSAPGNDYSNGRYRYDNETGSDYGRTGYGNYDGSYGAYTGVHGVTGYNTGTRDNFTTDYDRHYRPRYSNDMYDEDDRYRRYGQRDARYNYHPGDYGSVEIGEFRARENYRAPLRSRYRDEYFRH